MKKVILNHVSYWVDENKNKWSDCTEQQAIEKSSSLDDCTDCTNCTDCRGSHHCYYSTRLINCKSVSYSYDCTECESLSYCQWCLNCNNCNDCSDCENWTRGNGMNNMYFAIEIIDLA